MNPFAPLFDTSDFPPRWHCGNWSELHGWIHILSDTLIFVAYFAIPIAILWLVRKRPDVPFPRVFWLFAAFILLCGFGHLVEASLFWHPWYRFSALVKAATAVVSLATVVALIPVLREAIKIPGMARLNEQLQREMTGREEMEVALRHSEERVRSIIESALDAIVTIDGNGTITGWNAEAVRIFGWLRNEAIGKDLVGLIFPSQFCEAYRSGLRQLVENGASWIANHHLELTAQRQNGEAFPMELAISEFKSPGRTEFSAFIRDLSEIKRHDDRFRLVVESAPNAIIMVDAKGTIVLANAQAERLFGYSRAELLLLRIDNLLPARFRAHHPGFRQEYMAAPSVRSMGVGRDLFALNKDGAEVPVEIGLTPISARDGQFVLASIIDISERKRAEDAIRASLHEKEVLLKEVHHRVKNNLQIVSSLLNLQAGRVTHPEAVAALSESRNRIRTMALVHEKLYQAEHLGVLELAEYTRVLASELFSLYSGGAPGVLMDFHLAPLEIGIETAIPCSLIVNELLSNLLKYAFPGGRKGVALVELAREGETIRFSVRDDGVGFPPGFVIAKSNSMGLQLVTDLARQLGGNFHVESQPGRTHCCVTFPAERANLSAVAP